MYPQDQVIQFGTAPNASVNTSLHAAQVMAKHWSDLGETVEGIFVNTTVTGPFAAPMVGLDEVDPPLDSSSPPLYYQVLISGVKRTYVDPVDGKEKPVDEPSLTNYFATCQWNPIIASIGLQATTIQYLEFIDPNWRAYPDMVVAVALLPTNIIAPPIIIPTPVTPPPPTADTGLASPNWSVVIGEGWLSVRLGDTSPTGTVYSDFIHGEWIKCLDAPTPFAPSGSHPRWERTVAAPENI